MHRCRRGSKNPSLSPPPPLESLFCLFPPVVFDPPFSLISRMIPPFPSRFFIVRVQILVWTRLSLSPVFLLFPLRCHVLNFPHHHYSPPPPQLGSTGHSLPIPASCSLIPPSLRGRLGALERIRPGLSKLFRLSLSLSHPMRFRSRFREARARVRGSSDSGMDLCALFVGVVMPHSGGGNRSVLRPRERRPIDANVQKAATRRLPLLLP